jgi:hypothetical protein
MRKPRDYDIELKALEDKTKQLKQRKIQQLGELVIATGADALDPESLAGALLRTMEASDAARKESWRKRGAEFFQGWPRKSTGGPRRDTDSAQAGDGSAAPA